MFCLAAGMASAADHRDQALPIREAQRHLDARVFELGLDRHHSFQKKSVFEDGEAHVRLHQFYKGVRVFEGEAIAHVRNGEVRELTNALVKRIDADAADAVPSLRASEALAAAHAALAPSGPYASEPTSELVFARVEGMGFKGRIRDRMALAYHVHTELENGAAETKHMDYLVDAHSGEILEEWSSLKTGAAVGTGKSQWYGSVSLNTNTTATGYELRDMTRPVSTGNATYNMNHATSGTGSIYTDVDNAWGDGLGYVVGGSTTNDNGQTQGVDAHRGLQSTWDFYKSLFGRDGIDGAGRSTYSRVHYSSNYDNAFWSDSCFCMTYGDGDSLNGGSDGEADLDTAGHEVTHGVTSSTADLIYRGESGGLNEATSDIFGTCVEFWTLGGGGATVPNSASITVNGKLVSANYKMFENSWNHGGAPLRYMYKPSLDGRSPNFWYKNIKSIDVHLNSGPANLFFTLLSQGSVATPQTDNVVPPMANGVTSVAGISIDKACRIWYKALTAYMTSRTDYSGARTATLNAARDLYGLGSVEYNTVNLAWKAVNVL